MKYLSALLVAACAAAPLSAAHAVDWKRPVPPASLLDEVAFAIPRAKPSDVAVPRRNPHRHSLMWETTVPHRKPARH